MKRFIISGTLLLSLLACFAQWDSRATLEISAGGSMPIGEFAYSKYNYDGSGFAENGFTLGGAFNYRVNAHLGLVASVSNYFMGVDEQNLAMRYVDRRYLLNLNVEATRWKSNALMGGIDIILPIYHSDFHFRFIGGFARTMLPGLIGSAYNFQREATTDIAAAYGGGAGITYQNFDKVTFSIRLDFFMTRPVLDEIWSTDLSSGSREITQDIAIISLTGALGFRVF